MVTLSISSVVWTLTLNIVGGLIASAIWNAIAKRSNNG